MLILEYVTPASNRVRTWSAPKLLDGAVVQQSFWEVRMPQSTALLGVPAGWTDENEWYWDLYVWKRRPRFPLGALLEWVVREPNHLAETVPETADGRDHAYLFSSAGTPGSIRPVLVARAWLVAGFSGSVLIIGLVLLARRPPATLVVVAGLISALALGAAVEPSLIFLGLQSSAFGLVLVIVAALLQRSLDHRRMPATLVRDRARDSSLEALIPVAASPTPPSDSAGSDGSTVIRPRPGTTIEHVHKTGASAPRPVEEGGRPG